MKKIKLTNGGCVIVDDVDYPMLSKIKWHYRFRSCDNYYFIRGKLKTKGVTISMSKFIMNPPKGMVVDHINGNTFDNRRSNLRICTSGQNKCNSKLHKKNHATGLKGVYKEKANVKKKWRVKGVIYNGVKRERAKMFACPVLAKIEADRQRTEIHGEFANHG